MTDIHDYIELLNNELDNRYPNTMRVVISGGDRIRDCVMELREGNGKMQYSPYEMFVNSDENYEDSILELCNAWEKIHKNYENQ